MSIVKNPEMVEMMDRANFRIIVVGFESMDPQALRAIHKPSDPGINREATRLLRKYKMVVVAGGIYGYPDDDRNSVIRQFKLFKDLRPDLFYTQFLTPYPGTRVREDLLGEGVVENVDNFSLYDGFTCNIRTRHLSCNELFTTVRWLGFKAHLCNPLLMLKSAFLRKSPLPYIKGMLLAGRDQIYNLLLKRQVRVTLGEDLTCRKNYTASELFAAFLALRKEGRKIPCTQECKSLVETDQVTESDQTEC